MICSREGTRLSLMHALLAGQLVLMINIQSVLASLVCKRKKVPCIKSLF